MNTFEARGSFATAKIFVDSIEESALSQIYALLNHPAFEDSKVRIMPDCHAGVGCVIGFTADMHGIVVPNLVGVDISCGMYTVPVGNVTIGLNFEKLDEYIRSHVPHGYNVNERVDVSVENDAKFIANVETVANDIGDSNGLERFLMSVGSLGGGNHFIEIAVDSHGEMFLIIHSGSRNFGYRVARYHQMKAVEHCARNHIDIPKSLAYLSDDDADLYIEHMHVAELFADMSRKLMADRILEFVGVDAEGFTTTHNYLDVDTGIIRKGAINAEMGRQVLIPLNMRDGSILAVGRGNEDWNCSAPHGAGRIYSRSAAKATLSMDDFTKSMRSVYSTSVREDTLDESPMAYKPAELIVDSIGDTVDIIDMLRPLYNFKA